MKLYGIEYDFVTRNLITGEETSTDHKIETFHDVIEFINRTKHLSENNMTVYGAKYIFNLKVYVGDCDQLNIESVINPF